MKKPIIFLLLGLMLISGCSDSYWLTNSFTDIDLNDLNDLNMGWGLDYNIDGNTLNLFVDQNDVKTWGKVDASAGTDPEPDYFYDTLTFISGDGSITITGNAATDTLDLRSIGGSGTADGNIYSLGILSDLNIFQIDLNTIGDVNAFRLCINGDCISAWADLNLGSLNDTNVWTEGWLDDVNALVNDLNLNNNDILNVKRLAIGHDNPSANIHIYGGGLITWLKAEALGGTKTLTSEIDATGFEWLYTESSATEVRTNVGGIPTIDYDADGSKVNVHVFDELQWYDDEDRDGNYSGFKAYSDLNVSTTWTLPVQDGGSGQGICTDGSGQLYFCDVNTGGSNGTADGNIYSLGILSDLNIFQIDLNTIGDVNAFRLCINGDCISAWVDVNTYTDTNIPDTNLYTATLMNPDNNSWLIDLVPNVDADYGTAPDTGYELGLDTNRWLRLNALSFYTGLLDEQQTETSMFEGLRRCWNCAFEPPPDINYVHSLRKSGYAPFIQVPEWRQLIQVHLSGGVAPLMQNNISFLQQEDITLAGQQSMSDLNTDDHWWRGVRVNYPNQTSSTFREGISHYGARMDRYNGMIPIALQAPAMGCDIINPVFDEALPTDFDYSVELTGYHGIIEWEMPEPQMGYLHIDGVIESKQANSFRGYANYTVYNTLGQVITNPMTGEAGLWCNFVQMQMDLGMLSAPQALQIDWMIRVYDE